MKHQLKIISDAYQEYARGQTLEKVPQNLYNPVNYIMAMEGKHMRPLLMLSACQVFTADWQKCLPSAYALELFHNFTLVHDDIMDAARLRRGKDAVHIKYNTNQAILSGDVMLLKSLELMMPGFPAALRSKMTSQFITTCIEVCEGQQMDIDFETVQSIQLEDYLEMIKLKTAVLPAEALRLGALIGGSSEKDANLLYEYGLNLGLAFQIQDDILDAFGEQQSVGKVNGGDIRQNKKTILYIMGMEGANQEDQVLLEQLFSSDDQSDLKVEQVKNIWEKTEVLKRVNKVKNEYHLSCLNNLNHLENKSVDIGLLKYMSELLLDRAR